MDTIPATAPTGRDEIEAFRAQQLGALLRACRARARAVDDGMHRRARGLTQDQTAWLLHMHERTYREFESGRHAHPETVFLEHVAAALAMNPVEREVLFRMAGGRSAPPHPRCQADLADLTATIRGLPDDEPALVTDMAWNVLAWNRAVHTYFEDPTAMDDQDRNTLLWMLSPTAARRYPDVRQEYPAIVGRIHAAYLLNEARSPELRDLARRVQADPTTRPLWDAHVLIPEPGWQIRVLHHPAHGPRPMTTIGIELRQQGLRMIEHLHVGASRGQQSAS